MTDPGKFSIINDTIFDTSNSSHFNSTHFLNGSSVLSPIVATSTAATVTLTAGELWMQLIFFYGFLGGIVSTICSVLIWMGIYRKKNMRTRFFIIVGSLTFCRTWVCVQFLIMSIFRSLRTLNILNTLQYRIVCHTVHFWLINGWTIEMFLLCTLVADRVVAIVASNYYRLLTVKSAFHLCLAEYIILSLIKLVPSYVQPPFEIVKCINLYSFLSEQFNEFSQYLDLAMVGIILMLYFILIFYVKVKVAAMKKSRDKANDAANVALQRQLKLMPILRNLVLMHCGLALSSKILLSLSSVVPDAYSQRMTAYGGIMSVLDVFCNVSMLLVTNKEVRHASLPCLTSDGDGTKTNKVHTFTASVMRSQVSHTNVVPMTNNIRMVRID